MNNNDIFKKLRVALQLRDDQIVDILELVNFRISKGEIGNFFRNESHPKYVDCGDQILRNFLNGLVIYLRGTKEEPKSPMDVLKLNAEDVAKQKTKKDLSTKPTKFKDSNTFKAKTTAKVNKPTQKNKSDKPAKGTIVEKIRFKNGKSKKD